MRHVELPPEFKMFCSRFWLCKTFNRLSQIVDS